MAYPMGASKRGCRRVDFDRRLKLEFHGFKVTTGAGFLAYRELDDALERTEMAGDVFCDNRTGKNAWHGMTGQFRQSLFGRQWGMTTWTMPTVWDAIPPCVGLSAARPSDGCKEDGVSLPLDQWYDFQEFGCHLGNVGSSRSWRSLDRPVSLLGSTT